MKLGVGSKVYYKNSVGFVLRFRHGKVRVKSGCRFYTLSEHDLVLRGYIWHWKEVRG